jgi:hypothetical protein
MNMALWFILGCVVGALNMAARWWTVSNLYPQQQDGLAMGQALGGVFWRILLAGSLLVAALYQGILSGLLAFAGLETARWGLAMLISRRKLT